MDQWPKCATSYIGGMVPEMESGNLYFSINNIMGLFLIERYVFQRKKNLGQLFLKCDATLCKSP